MSYRVKSMNNVMIIDGHKAVIQYEPETDVLRGEFVGLNGGQIFMQITLLTCIGKV